MIDHFTIFTQGGMVLWTKSFARLRGSPIDQLVRLVLLEERGGENGFNLDQYTLKWSFANNFELIFVVVYQKILSLLYIDDLLERVKERFIELFKDVLLSMVTKGSISNTEFNSFDQEFNTILDEAEFSSKRRPRVQRTFGETEKGKAIKEVKIAKGEEIEEETPKNPQHTRSSAPAPNTPKDDDEDEVAQNRKKFIERRRAGPGPVKKVEENKSPVTKRKPKPNREPGEKLSREEAEKLDKSVKTDAAQSVNAMSIETVNMDESEEEGEDVEEEVSEEETNEVEKSQGSSSSSKLKSSSKKQGSSFGFMKYFKGLTGNRTLEEEDLESVISKLKQHLQEKNVAVDISEKLCQSVSASLVGQKMSTFQTVHKTVMSALDLALTRILTPKRNIDVLRDIAEVKGKRPYTIVFVGVNGVGKSTNLAKVCAWLMQNGQRVMIAACDTFRSGAIEQLRVHSDRLNVPLFQRGYGKDAAEIAAEAIVHAKEEKFDVVLVDTAGRMQDNEPLMHALSKLVNTNKIDLVLFVGEALVGNDGVDQLVKFNQSLADLAATSTSTPRLIDGIILTKFDTIDDKVGAAISMVYSTGIPILFLGVGQHYTDIKRMNVKTIIKTLLKV